MILGSGLIANAFKDKYAGENSNIIFASGVSNSGEINPLAFSRERDLLLNTISRLDGKRIIYFSTCSIYDPDLANSKYVQHKLSMESLVRTANTHLIFRAPQVIGKPTNPYTFPNFIYSQITKGKPLLIWQNARRHYIDIEDLRDLVDYFINDTRRQNETINIGITSSVSPLELLHNFEKITGKSASFTLINKGAPFDFDFQHCLDALQSQDKPLPATKHYLDKILKKYYA